MKDGWLQLLLALMTGLNCVVSFTPNNLHNLHSIPKHALRPKSSCLRRSLFCEQPVSVLDRAVKHRITCSVAHTGAEPSRGSSKAAGKPTSMFVSIIKTFTTLMHGFLLFLRDVYGQFLVLFMDTLINRF
jgi:hypothetical protein